MMAATAFGEHLSHNSHNSHPSHGTYGRDGNYGGHTRSPRAFTFVEILACMVFLGILIPAVVEGIGIANRASLLAERGAVATELAENKLSELTLNDAWATGETRGDFGTDQPGYRWEANQSTWDMDAMIQLTMDVFYTVQGQEHSVRLSTLVSQSQTQSQSTTQAQSGALK